MSSNTSTMGSGATQGMGNGSLMMSAGSLAQSGASAYAAYTSGRIQQNMMKVQAMQSELQARQEKIKGAQASNIIREQLLQNLASTNVMFVGGGVNVGSGTARQAGIESRKRAMEDINQVQINSESASAAQLAQGQQYLGAGKIAKQAGTMRAFQTLNSRDTLTAASSLIGGFSGAAGSAKTGGARG